MPQFSKKSPSQYTTSQIFDIVSDVASYPKFLPWVAAARIDKISKNEFEAELIIKFKGLRSSYTSLVTLTHPESSNSPCIVSVALVKGPFRTLINEWNLEPSENIARNISDIDFFIDFSFQSSMFEKMVGGMFEKATNKMTEAFETRAKQLYGMR